MAEQHQTNEVPWQKHFFKSESSFNGYVRSIEAVNELIANYEMVTVSKFAIWRTEKRGFGHTGKFANQATIIKDTVVQGSQFDSSEI